MDRDEVRRTVVVERAPLVRGASRPSRMIERVGRDEAQAIERWNMRADKEAAE